MRPSAAGWSMAGPSRTRASAALVLLCLPLVAAAGSDDSAARSRGDYGYAQARRASPRGDPSARVGKTNPIPVRRCYFSSNLELTARSFVFVSLSLSRSPPTEREADAR